MYLERVTNMSRYFTVNEIAYELDISTRTVYRMLEGGLLKGFKTGRIWRVSRDDLADYLSVMSNLDSDTALSAGIRFDSKTVRPFQELAYPVPPSRRISDYRVLLERHMPGCEAELFELPLEVEESQQSFLFRMRDNPANSIKIPWPDKNKAAIRRFLQSDSELWSKSKTCFAGDGSPYDWASAFCLEGLSSSEKAVLQWAYNLEDTKSRPLIEGASVADRLSLLDKMSPAQRKAALASLEMLYADDTAPDNQR